MNFTKMYYLFSLSGLQTNVKRLSGEIVELKQHLEHYDKVQELTQMLQESHRCGRGGEWDMELRQGRVQELQESHRFRGAVELSSGGCRSSSCWWPVF